jgi:vancomycin resistance protein YoaR
VTAPSALALGAAALVASSGAARAAEGEALRLRVTHGGASVEVTAEALGAHVERGDGAVAAVRWDGARLAAECEALGDELGLAPPFEGDVELTEDGAEAVLPVAGEQVDCAALAVRVERGLAGGGAQVEAREPRVAALQVEAREPRVAALQVEAPVVAREPRVAAAQVEALASDVRELLASDVALDVTYLGQVVGQVRITPDDVRDALRVAPGRATRWADGEEGRLEARLTAAALRSQLDPVMEALGGAARDAEFVVAPDGSVRVAPGQPGARVDEKALFAAAAGAAKAADKKGAVAASKGDPALTTKKAESLAIKNQVATFTTRHPCCQARVTNIHRIATLLDGAIVEAGERFSMNRHVGQRTTKRGFVLAPSIGEGEMVETVGGGVSQVATTLYNAVFDAGYAVVSRKPHTFYFNRYPMGVEATLSWPRPDFVFRNDSKAAVLIKASFTDDSITVKLYGDTGGRKVQRFVSKTFAPTDPRTDYEPDESMPLTKTKVKDAGTQGFSVKSGRDIVFPDGTKKHEERKVVYHGKPRIVIAHPCAIPKGEKGHRKKGCPKIDPNAPPDADVAKTDEKDADKSAGSAAAGKSGEGKGAADKASGDKAPADKGSADKGSADKVASEKGGSDKAAVDKPAADKGESDKAGAKDGEKPDAGEHREKKEAGATKPAVISGD